MRSKSGWMGFQGYLEKEESGLNREIFEQQMCSSLDPSLAVLLSPGDFQVFFEIGSAYRCLHRLTQKMDSRGTIIRDWNSSSKVIAEARKRIADFRGDLVQEKYRKEFTNTLNVVKWLSDEIQRLNRRLEREFEIIELQQRVSKSMLRSVPLKVLRSGCIAELDNYAVLVLSKHGSKRPKVEKINQLVTAAMIATKIFTKKELEDDPESRIPMARSRANAQIKKEILDLGEFPVFQTKPKTKNSL